VATPTGQQPFHFKRGNRIPASYLNEVSRGIVQRITGRGLRVRRLGTNIVVDAETDPLPQTPGIQMMRVTAVKDDWLEASEWDGANLGTSTFQVAKPAELRKTDIDGETFTLFRGTFSYAWTSEQERVSTNTSDSSTETQVIVPPYEIVYPLNLIWVGRPMNGTNLVDLNPRFDNDVPLLDLNVAGRAWAEETP
tara:strand:- start:569 stop:1150 length:582 start_codon:yes stop_codon:yes gene_type:complete